MRVQEFAFRAEEDSVDSLDVDFETRDMSVQIKSAVNDTETEITDMEFNNEYIDENRLVDLEQNLEKEESGSGRGAEDETRFRAWYEH